MAPKEKPEDEKTVLEESDLEDPFNPLVKILCDMRSDWEIKRRILLAIGKLVGAPPNRELLEKVANCISDPVESQK